MNPMRRHARWLYIAIAMAPACAPKRTVESVYRYVNVGRGDKIQLGASVVPRALTAQVDDTTFRLLPGTFGGGGTQSIVGRTDASGVVRSLMFVYDGSEPLGDKVRQYTASLGKPLERRDSPDGVVYTWQDDSTRFELHYDPKNEPAFWSVLSDRTATLSPQ